METKSILRNITFFAFLLSLTFLVGCDDDAPDEENEEEVITNVKLIFTNANDATDIVTAEAIDPDGEGVQDLVVEDEIDLKANTTYNLTYSITNELESPAEDITEEIEEEGDEHQIFYSFTNNIFSSPTGNGNIDNAADALNYDDSDDNGNPIGLETSWTTGSAATGTFTINIQHQPDVKTATSDTSDGETEVDLTFDLNITNGSVLIAI